MRTFLAVRTLLAVLLLVASHAAAGRVEDAGLRYTVPNEWPRVPAPSDVRAAQYRIPRVPNDAEDGELVLFFFGKGQGGAAEDNLQRWYGQFNQPDGRTSKEAAVVTIRTVNGLKVTLVDLGGTYKPGPMGGNGGGARPNWRMLGAVIEGGSGPWFLKATGPNATITDAKPAFENVISSLEPH
jgi:hypothetical protein